MSHVFPRDISNQPPSIVRGEGSYLIDDAGRRYLDASGGPAVSCLGHNHPKVVAAIQRQVAEVSYAYSLFFTTPAIEELAEILTSQAPAGIDKAFFVSGGSEAIEGALKMARQYFLEVGQPQRSRFIARQRSYHGNTLGALSLGGDVNRRQPYEPMLQPVNHIAPCYEYRYRRADESAEAYGLRVADELEAALLAQGPDTVAAFVCEPVVGASLGAVPAVPGYLKRIREICDRYGVLLIFDEVMCGMGRTGHLYACQEDQVTPDIITVAKGLGGGYMPIGGLLVHERIYRAIADGSGTLKHGHTYAGHTLACAGALAVQQVVKEEGLLAEVRRKGQLLRGKLEERFGQHPHVGDIRGRGLLLGLELVADRETKATLDPAKKTWLKIRQTAMEKGLLCYPGGGCIDGKNGDHIILAPAYNIPDAQLDEIVDKLGRSLDQVLGTA